MNKYARTPDHILDLHGYTTREALPLLDEALDPGRYRQVRVITGKGTHHDGPVMRTFVSAYLKEHGLEFRPAKLYDGGEGAFEVLLK